MYAGETPIEGRGFPRPLVLVEPPGALTGGLQHLTVRSHDALGGGMWRLEFSAVSAAPRDPPVATVKYRMGADLELPLRVGEPLAVRFTQTLRGIGLVIWDESPVASPANTALGREDHTLIAALAVGIESSRELGADAIGELGPEPDFDVSHLAYAEVKLAASGCAEATEHFDLKIRVGEAAAWLPPGAMRRVSVGGAEFDFVAIDASRADPRFPPPTAECPSGAHVSWVLLRAAPGP